MVRRYAREGLHRPRNQDPWAIKSSFGLGAAQRGTRCATESGVPLDRELKQLKIAHISQLANSGGISEFRGKMAKQALGGSIVYGWQKTLAVPSHRGFGLAFTRVGMMF